MSNDVDQTQYRRLSGSNVSPGLRRSKSVRASFRILGARWKPTHNKNEVLIKKDRTNKDVVLERFGKELNETRSHAESFLKGTTKFFYGLKSTTATKENVPLKSEFYAALPANVAPKAAALLQIPMPITGSGIEKKLVDKGFRIDCKMGELITNSEQFDDFRKTGNDGGCNRSYSSGKSNSSCSSKSSEDTTSTTSGGGSIVERSRTATIRRAPYWTNNLVYKPLGHNHVVKTATIPSCQSRVVNDGNYSDGIGFAVDNPVASDNNKLNEKLARGLATKQIAKITTLNRRNSDNNFNQGMEFLIPQAPSAAVRHSQPPLTSTSAAKTLSSAPPSVTSSATALSALMMARKNGGIFLNGNEMKENFHLLQAQHKMTKKQLKLAQAQLDKITQINIHLQALFSAVENGHLEKARTILESTDVDINSLNSDGFSPLDVAVLSNNRSLTKMLLQHGAVEGNKFKSPDSLGNHLNALLRDADNRINELSGGAEDVPQIPFSTRASFSSIIGNAYTGPSVSGCTGTEAEKQIGLWERRMRGLRRMLLGWDQTKPPDPPYLIGIDVIGVNSVAVRIQESCDGPIATKFKVQWSSRADFSNIVGEREVNEWNSFQSTMGANCRIGELTQGRRYFFRACCGNIKGWGPYRVSIPNSVVPSSWRDLDNIESRFAGRLKILDDLFTAVRLSRPDDASDISEDTPALQRRNPKKKTTIKQLFSAASKFQKNLRRGIYLACIVYHEDKILVTNEDFLPVIEIDETYPSSLHTDYHWLMKVSCTWDDAKSLRTDMERNPTSAVHFRTKLLTAACQMQSALCIQDLGQLYHKPLRDSHGTVVLACVNNVKSQKCVSVLNSRWIPLNKVQKKLTAIHEDNNINELLLGSIQEQINYHQNTTLRLSKGLYLGYLKMQSSVDQIQIVVPAKTPNILPHCKIRDNNHISAEEWKFLKRNKMPCAYELPTDRPTGVQELFIDALTHAAQRLFKYMDIPTEDALTHRLYDFEVIELSAEVGFLIVCPRAESSCAVPGQREILLQRGDLLSLPIQAFEMVHLKAYQSGIIQKYSRLSCILELDTILANHLHREAFSTSELQTAKERLAKLQELSQSLNAIWKGSRWLMDVIGFARDRANYLGLNMRDIFEFNPGSNDDLIDNVTDQKNRQLLQPPARDHVLMKTSPGRGSWPGPSHVLGTGTLLGTEHSKSEQQLSVSSFNLSSQYLSAASGADNNSSRKNSADSNYSHSGNSYYSAGESTEHIAQRLPPSRSEDTLNIMKKPAPPLHRKRSTTINSNFSSAPSPSTTMAKATGAHVRPTFVKTTTHSMHSLSSDSECGGSNITTSTPVKSDSSKLTLFDDSKLFKEPLRIDESEKQQPQQPQQIQQPTTSTNPFVQMQIEANRRENEEHSKSPEKSSKIKVQNAQKADDDEDEETGASGNKTVNNAPGIIQVYAAYDTGLASGTSLKLRVTPKTTAREVIDLVVKQLNMAVVLKGREGPIYTADRFDNFCLVAVIGARERCLRDDFKPLQLQNPWQKGRLYVRQKHDLLAAIEHSNRDAQLV